jgi:hypothetical protein
LTSEKYIFIIPWRNNLTKVVDLTKISNHKLPSQLARKRQCMNIPVLFHSGGQGGEFLQILCVERSPFKETEKRGIL